MIEKQEIEWIPISEGLPNIYESVLLRTNYEGSFIYQYGEYWGFICGEHRFGYNSEYEFDYVTHWARI